MILKCLGTAFGHFHLGSHNFMVTALGSCVKWPFVLLSVLKFLWLQKDSGCGCSQNVSERLSSSNLWNLWETYIWKPLKNSFPEFSSKFQPPQQNFGAVRRIALSQILNPLVATISFSFQYGAHHHCSYEQAIRDSGLSNSVHKFFSFFVQEYSFLGQTWNFGYG